MKHGAPNISRAFITAESAVDYTFFNAYCNTRHLRHWRQLKCNPQWGRNAQNNAYSFTAQRNCFLGYCEKKWDRVINTGGKT